MSSLSDLNASQRHELELEAQRFMMLADLKMLRELIVSLCRNTNPLPNAQTIETDLQEKFEAALQQLLAVGADIDPKRAAYIVAYVNKVKHHEDPYKP